MGERGVKGEMDGRIMPFQGGQITTENNNWQLWKKPYFSSKSVIKIIESLYM
jgi:hypothetical protein